MIPGGLVYLRFSNGLHPKRKDLQELSPEAEASEP